MPSSSDEADAAAPDETVAGPDDASRSSGALTAEEREDLLAENRRAREALAADAARTPGKVVEKPSRSGGPSLVVALVGVITVLLVAVGVLSYFVATDDEASLGPDAGIGAQALADARTYAALVVTYAPGDFADLDRRIREISTPGFADDYIKSSQEARRGTDEAKATSVGTAVASGLESINDAEAVVLVALDQKITSPDLPSAGDEGLAYQTRVRVTLLRDGDRWRLAGLVTL